MKKQHSLVLEDILAQSNCDKFLIKRALDIMVGKKADAFAGNQATIKACLL